VPAPQEATVLNVWFNFGAQHDATVTRLQDWFMEENPDIKIERTDIGDWDQMRQKTLTAFSAGTGPDIFRIAVFDTAMYAVRNATVPLDDLVAGDPLFGTTDVFIDGFLANCVYGGKLWALPWKGSAVALFWNKHLFEDAGLDPETPPTTWDEVATMAKQLTKADEQQFGYHVQYSESAEGMNFFGPLLYSHGADLFDSLDPSAVTEAAFNTENGVAALQYVLDRIADESVNPPGMTIQDIQINEKVAIWSEGQWAVGNYGAQKPDLEYGTTLIPDSSLAGSCTVTGGDHIAISSVCKNVPEAWRFCAWANTPEVEDWYWPIIGGLPGRKEVASSEVYGNKPYVAFMDQLETCAKPRPGVPDITEVLAAIMVEVQLAQFGQQDATTAMAKAETKVNEILERRRQMGN